MNNFPDLVDLERDGFRAVLPTFKSLPLEISGQVAICYYDNDIQGAFEHAFEMFLEALPADKFAEFDELDNLSKKLFIANWITT